ncbi:WG repeat-containing protein [Lacinutrix sp. WUR7]|uniref:WG repeat-containing protein n=1 Tax=Lacinutrix sp. WUR7 TaxID=2653681 RepID=UPI00193DC5E8|nr:WG repeat-containing protein [Lacinutrix sp. WUR7]QRM89355.1 WG repeat-containing protein [Lacinutrix sp. WUR7]
MKKLISLFALLLIPLLGFTQTMENLDYISTFNEDLAAIKKDNQWAFINKEGTVVIDFRDDVVETKTEAGNYPIFNNERCLIKQKKDGINYYGFIDTSGKTVIEPQFLNATTFNNNYAIALELVKVDLGRNNLLNKEIVEYKYFQVVIDTSGKIKTYLTEAIPVELSATNLKKAPAITSQFISEKLVAVMTKNKQWNLKKID